MWSTDGSIDMAAEALSPFEPNGSASLGLIDHRFKPQSINGLSGYRRSCKPRQGEARRGCFRHQHLLYVT
jgi:hypothetical protein